MKLWIKNSFQILKKHKFVLILSIGLSVVCFLYLYANDSHSNKQTPPPVKQKTFSKMIPKGHRVLPLDVNIQNPVFKILKAGDYVDLLFTSSEQKLFQLERIKVLGLSRKNRIQEEAEKMGTLLISLPKEKASLFKKYQLTFYKIFLLNPEEKLKKKVQKLIITYH